LFTQDTAWAMKAVNDEGLDISQNQFDALVSLCYNLGEPNFKKSNVVKLAKVNPNDSAIRDAFLAHNKTQGIPSPVLTARRFREAEMYFNTEFKNTLFMGIGILAIGAGFLFYFLNREAI